MRIRDAVEAAAVEAADEVDVVRRDVGTRTEWLAAGTLFATLDGDAAEYRLSPVVARAALGTPETSASPRGPDWVLFRPTTLDRTAVDRASAWFVSAARRAAEARS